MDSALISVIGTLVGVIAGGFGTYLTTSRTTAKTLRVQTENTLRQMDASHGQRLQEMQASAYEQAIAALKYRRDKREHNLSPVRWDKNTESVIRSTLDDYRPPNWYESQSQLDLYASQAVLNANKVANEAHQKILDLTRELANLREQVEATDPTDRDARSAFGAQHAAIYKKIKEALKEASTADDNFIQAMRTGVHARPSQYLSAPPKSTNSLVPGSPSGPQN